jgi:hypothetical protein
MRQLLDGLEADIVLMPLALAALLPRGDPHRLMYDDADVVAAGAVATHNALHGCYCTASRWRGSALTWLSATPRTSPILQFVTNKEILCAVEATIAHNDTLVPSPCINQLCMVLTHKASGLIGHSAAWNVRELHLVAAVTASTLSPPRFVSLRHGLLRTLTLYDLPNLEVLPSHSFGSTLRHVHEFTLGQLPRLRTIGNRFVSGCHNLKILRLATPLAAVRRIGDDFLSNSSAVEVLYFTHWQQRHAQREGRAFDFGVFPGLCHLGKHALLGAGFQHVAFSRNNSLLSIGENFAGQFHEHIFGHPSKLRTLDLSTAWNLRLIGKGFVRWTQNDSTRLQVVMPASTLSTGAYDVVKAVLSEENVHCRIANFESELDQSS